MKNLKYIIVLVLVVATSCSYPKNFTKDFYAGNEATLATLREEYNSLFNEKPFALLFETKDFKNIAFEIIADSIKYIYNFDLTKTNFVDTLSRYHYNVQKIQALIQNMQRIQCAWITKLNYYENFNVRHLILMAIRNKALNSTFKGESYCTLAFFDTPQPIDEYGRILDRANRIKNRRINGYKLIRIDDKVGYAITKHYR